MYNIPKPGAVRGMCFFVWCNRKAGTFITENKEDNRVDQRFEPLFTPWKIRDVEIKNRIVLCPMGGTSLFGWMEPNHFDKVAADFFLERARNNVGLIIPGIAPSSR